ncbi:M48 family metalloprotease [Marinobacteraceae bacterium S3BR75-40.1]
MRLHDLRPYIRPILHASILTLLLVLAGTSFGDEPLPDLGGAGGGLFSSQEEEAIGQQVLRSLRQNTPLIEDPLLLDYLHSVVYELVPYAPLADRNLTLVMIDDPEINAFAVPGGIIGVNGGLFLHAESEQQFAAVMAHELAHLSQRHFARRLENQKLNQPLAIAGMVTGIILSAVTHSDLGIAAIAGSQAAVAQDMLQYSRYNEQEADRVGMQILARADFDPQAMPQMFEQMLQQARLQGNRPPEYLSTHPLTESRVADTRNRAAQYPSSSSGDSLEYHLMRARMMAHYAESPDMAVKRFEAFVKDNKETPRAQLLAARYGYAVALLQNGQAQQAVKQLKELLQDVPGRITFLVSLSRAYKKLGELDNAQSLLKQALDRNPDNFPISRALADVTLEKNEPLAAARLLQRLTRQHPADASLWQALAEAQGKARNIVEVHRAQAEYALLMGDPEQALLNLREALKKAADKPSVQDVIRDRMEDARKQMRRQNQ